MLTLVGLALNPKRHLTIEALDKGEEIYIEK